MDTTKIIILGANGQLGKALQSKYPQARAADSKELDVTNIKALEAYDWSGIDTIINAAAYTNVDGAETAEGRKAAWQVNAQAVGLLTEIARKYDMTLVHISTDYVFDGSQDPHTETEAFAPLSVYGASKAAGDLLVGQLPKHYILRVSWVIGDGNNFVRTMLGLGQKGVSPTVVADQFGRLTFTDEIVRAIDHLLIKHAPAGTYNASNDGEVVSWADITRAIFKEAGFDLNVTDTTTAEYYAGKTRIAPRPLHSALDLSKLQATGFTPADWQDSLHKYLAKEPTS
jgi:dTDP-4-dehydrorhamnose reductase